MNPILKNRFFLVLYVLAWLFAVAVQAGILVFYPGLEIVPALIDSIVFNTIFFLSGLAVWYPLNYIPLQSRSLFTRLLTFAALGIMLILGWISLGFVIMSQLYLGHEGFVSLLIRSIPYRVLPGALLYVVLLMVYYLIINNRKLQERIQNEARLQSMMKESELSMLRAQINPHFLFNSLNSASALTISDPAGARAMIIKLSEYLRHSLKLSGESSNPLKQEIANINRYLEIEKVRFGEKMVFSINCCNECESRIVPNMILQPLIENAVKHGVYESTEVVRIVMKCMIEGEMLVIRITNDYDSDGRERRGAGIGIRNIRERLKLIYGREDLMLLKKENGEFTVTLFIPENENKGTDH